jgi:hypothetical protein
MRLFPAHYTMTCSFAAHTQVTRGIDWYAVRFHHSPCVSTDFSSLHVDDGITNKQTPDQHGEMPNQIDIDLMVTFVLMWFVVKNKSHINRSLQRQHAFEAFDRCLIFVID